LRCRDRLEVFLAVFFIGGEDARKRHFDGVVPSAAGPVEGYETSKW
jgi:hypothetical protein